MHKRWTNVQSAAHFYGVQSAQKIRRAQLWCPRYTFCVFNHIRTTLAEKNHSESFAQNMNSAQLRGSARNVFLARNPNSAQLSLGAQFTKARNYWRWAIGSFMSNSLIIPVFWKRWDYILTICPPYVWVSEWIAGYPWIFPIRVRSNSYIWPFLLHL